jgi:hypothetical protein
VAAWQWGLEWRALGVNELEPARRLGNNSTAGRGAKFLSTLHEAMTASVSMEASARAMRCQRRCRCRCRCRCRRRSRCRCRCKCRSSGSASPKKVVWKSKRPSPSARSVHAPIGPFTCACLTSLATGDAEGQTSLKHRNKEGPSRPSTPGGSDQNSQRGGCSKEPPARAHAALAGHSGPFAPSHTRLARRAPSLGRLGRRLACPKGVGSPCADRAVCAVAAVGRSLCGQ